MNFTEKEKNDLIEAYETRTPVVNYDSLKNKDLKELYGASKILGLWDKYPDFDYRVGRKYGRLTVVRKVEKDKYLRYECKCDCGNVKIVPVGSLASGVNVSCGCISQENRKTLAKSRIIDLTGKTFSYLTVLGRDDDYVSPSGNVMLRWRCRCVCGKETSVVGNCLKNGNIKSCGCMQKELNGKAHRKVNRYDLSGDYGVGYDVNDREFYFDKEDYDLIKNFRWQVDPTDGYVTSTDRTRNYAKVRMHRLIMGLYPGNKEIKVDHIHSERKNDNRKVNLRLATPSQNAMNMCMMPNNTSGVTGVSYVPKKKLWMAYITKDGVRRTLGVRKDFDKAVELRRNAEEELFGDRSYRNSQSVNID